jgi:hypothetical protein
LGSRARALKVNSARMMFLPELFFACSWRERCECLVFQSRSTGPEELEASSHEVCL